VQPIGGSVAGKLAKEVLIAGGLAVVIILLVETGAGQRHIASLRVPCFAAAQFWSQGLDRTAGTEDAREGVIALGAVELETEFAGQVNPDRHLLLFSGRGIAFCQALDDLSPDEVTEQIRFGGFRDVLQAIEVALAQSVQHEGAVVF
jgi:hypothetical protein